MSTDKTKPITISGTFAASRPATATQTSAYAYYEGYDLDKEVEDSRRFTSMLKRFTYKPGYTFELVEGMFESCVLLCRYTPIDSIDPEGRRIPLRVSNAVHPSTIYDEHDFLAFMRDICNRIERHETDEWIKLDGVAPFYPH